MASIKIAFLTELLSLIIIFIIIHNGSIRGLPNEEDIFPGSVHISMIIIIEDPCIITLENHFSLSGSDIIFWSYLLVQ